MARNATLWQLGPRYVFPLGDLLKRLTLTVSGREARLYTLNGDNYLWGVTLATHLNVSSAH